MPHRTTSILLGVIGLVALVGLFLAHADLARAARSGPAWRRRIVGAGLALLASFGLYSPAAAEPAAKPAAAATTATPSARLAATAEWKRIQQTWSEAEAIASGARGAYPFDEAGKKRTLAALDGAVKDVAALLKVRKLGAPESELLHRALHHLRTGVVAKRPTSMRRATCYEPMPYQPPGQESLERLRDRLPLLEKLAAARRVDPAVLDKVLRQIEKDIQTIESLGPDPKHASLRPEAQKAAQRARTHIAKIRTLAGVK